MLLPLGNESGTHKFFSLDKGSFVHANSWVPLPTHDIVVREMCHYAELQEVQRQRKHDKRRPRIGEPERLATATTVDGVTAAEHWGLETLETEAEADQRDHSDSPDITPIDNGNDGAIENIRAVHLESQHSDNEIIMPAAETITRAPQESPFQIEPSQSASEVRVTRSGRHIRTPKTLVLHMQIVQVPQKYSRKATESALAGLREIWERGVFLPLLPNDMSRRRGKKVLRSFMFMKEKINIDDSLRKLKARLVADGSSQDHALFESVASPTAILESILMIFAIAAVERRHIMSLGNA